VYAEATDPYGALVTSIPVGKMIVSTTPLSQLDLSLLMQQLSATGDPMVTMASLNAMVMTMQAAAAAKSQNNATAIVPPPSTLLMNQAQAQALQLQLASLPTGSGR
jgi:hypothetical protein